MGKTNWPFSATWQLEADGEKAERSSASAGFVAVFLVVPPVLWFVAHAGFGWREIM